ncbi:protein DpdE [Micromonospora arida]|uniref:protein DpdE n=1 Tax=Micromonospora arida TaxID=2203715 RepID=UPI003CEEB998
MLLPTGQFVEHPQVPGIGRVGERRGGDVRIDAFESIARPVAQSYWVPADECRLAQLLPQTRVYWQDPDTGRWRAGRIIGGGPGVYFVRLPNKDLDFQVPQQHLRVRWDRPIASPVEVLAAGANESPYFRDARLPMLSSLVAQRAACADLPALLSAAIEIYPHQVQAALTVLSDPVQRYLLADEVGLGKTIEAGLVIRQRLLDQPTARIVVLAPDMLRQQWSRELQGKFFTEDFPAATIKITRHETPDKWEEYHGFDLVVVDEAHRLTDAADPTEARYRELTQLAHSTPRLLLLSATPPMSQPQAHLGMLHLLDPTLYRWEDLPQFTQRFQARRVLANAVFALDADFEPLLPSAIAEISDLLPGDITFRDLAGRVSDLLTADGDLIDDGEREILRSHVDALRAHISETYRMHRRIIRHRRHNVLTSAGDDSVDALPFEVTGRQRPTVLSVAANDELVSESLVTWQQHVSHWLLDHNADDRTEAYGLVLAVLSSRSDGLSGDLQDALRWRIHRDDAAARRAGLSEYEREVLAAAAVLPDDEDLLRKLDDNDAAEPDMRDYLQVLGQHKRAVMFCGAGSLAGLIADVLTPNARVRITEHTHRRGAAASAMDVDRWRAEGGLLIADDSAEDGVNLQEADAVIHLRLPWSPNQCEQRLGRVDRFAGAFGAGHRAAMQYVAPGGHADNSFAAVWTTLLTSAVRIFDDSVSALQYAFNSLTTTIWETGLRDGPAAMLEMADMVADVLRKERREIDGMDTVEAVHEGSLGLSVAEAMTTTEIRWGAHEKAMRLYAGAEAGGLRFAVHPEGSIRHVMRFERAHANPLVSPRLLAISGRSVPPAAMQGTFNRNTALRTPNTRLFRLGNPFVDLLANVVAIDDRGQACVFWRPGVRGRELRSYFGFDFLVEPDIEPALELVGDAADAVHALRRQASVILPPIMRRIWLPSQADQAVQDPDLLRWLEAPYAQDRGDLNLNDERISALWQYFGDIEGLATAARSAEATARDELTRSAQLVRRAEQAQHEAGRAWAVRRAQAEARRNAGRLLSDTDSYLTDVRVAAALIDALKEPKVRLMAVTCVTGGELGVPQDGN